MIHLLCKQFTSVLYIMASQILMCGIESALHGLWPVLVKCVSGYSSSLFFEEKLLLKLKDESVI